MTGSFPSWVPLKRDLIIESNTDNIHLVEVFIDGIREELQFADDVYGNVMVAITEAVNNGIIHGNKESQGKKVYISVETINPFRLTVNVRDEGEGFNPDVLKDPTAPENIGNPGGRGVFLMKHLADQVSFEDEGRKVNLFFNI